MIKWFVVWITVCCVQTDCSERGCLLVHTKIIQQEHIMGFDDEHKRDELVFDLHKREGVEPPWLGCCTKDIRIYRGEKEARE